MILNHFDFDLPCRTSIDDVLEVLLMVGSEIYPNTKGRFKVKKKNMISNFVSTFLVELHLDDVLEHLLVV